MRMTRLATLAMLVAAAPAMAQHAQGAGGTVPTPPNEARQFDFLIGEWELEVRPAVSGLAAKLHGAPKLAGTWKGWRAFDGWGVEDELRILDTRGNLRTIAHAMRVYDQSAGRWALTTLDVLAARFSPGSASWSGKEMTTTVPGKDGDGKAILTRVRYFEITPNGFKYEQARSYDNGRTWEDPTLRISARRVAAAASR